MAAIKFVPRTKKPEIVEKLISEGVSEIISQLLAARGVVDVGEIDTSLGKMLKPGDLKGANEAGKYLAKSIVDGEKICVVADYDCDGASAAAVMVRGLNMLGAKENTVSYLVPDRTKDGYGLTPVIVERAKEQFNPDTLITVDNGIASFAGVKLAVDLGMKMIVTDHHLPAVNDDGVVQVPEATVIVNPSQPGCNFGSKAMCGAGVAFYTMLTTRSALRDLGVFDASNQPRLDALLELVALATVADVVKLDENNRRLIAAGLDRIRTKGGIAGIRALFDVSGRKAEQATSTDIGFTIGPRINAAGRLSDMTLGIECLLTDDKAFASELAGMLHKINQERREVEAGMVKEADAMVSQLQMAGQSNAIVVYDESFHEGVVGIVAGKIKEAQHRPTFVFAKSHEGDLKGSGRSIPGFHLRDALDLISKRHPNLILKFGGHAMAAGCTINKGGLEEFRSALSEIADELLTKEMLEHVVLTDGELGAESYTLDIVKKLNDGVWGQGFEAPIFVDRMQITNQRLVGEKHLQITALVNGQRRQGIWFGRTEPLGSEVDLAYKVGVNEWNGKESVQMLVEGCMNYSHQT